MALKTRKKRSRNCIRNATEFFENILAHEENQLLVSLERLALNKTANE